MTVGPVVLYNGATDVLKTSSRQWDDATPGNIMFALVNHTYTPYATHATLANVASYITSGDGAPINATGLVMTTQSNGYLYCTSDPANFGSSVTITAKYLIAIQPVTAGAATTTSKLIFYVDLDTTSSGNNVSSSAAPFSVVPPVTGWFEVTK